MKEKVAIVIEDLDDIQKVLASLDLLFQKLIYYYLDKDLSKLKLLIVCVSFYFGELLRMIGYDEDDLKELE